MSNFTNALKNGFGNLEAELEAGLIGNDECRVMNNELNNINNESDTGLIDDIDGDNVDSDDTASIKTDADLSDVNETDMFNMEDYSEGTNINKESKETNLNTEPHVSYDKRELILEAYDEIWEFIKEWNSFSKEEKKEITNGKDILSFTPVKAMNLVDDWKESKRIHIGDIISCEDKIGICVAINIKDNIGNDCFLVSNGEEELLYFDKNKTIKTSKHVDIKGLI